MFNVTKVIHFCYGHRLLNYDGKCRYLHGHNGRVEIELSSKRLDRLGMVRDFTEIKREIQTWIDRHLDHKMILCRRDPVLPPEDATAAQRRRLIQRVPLKRLGAPQDIANTVLFLIEGTDFMTGSLVLVDGGQLIA